MQNTYSENATGVNFQLIAISYNGWNILKIVISHPILSKGVIYLLLGLDDFTVLETTEVFKVHLCIVKYLENT